jgi:PhnB protein
MAKSVKPIPDGYHTLTVYLMVRGAADAIEFYKRAFGAVECMRMPGPDGKTIGHAELKIGDSMLMLADEQAGAFGKSPESLGGTPFCFVMYVENADAAFERAVKAGAKVLRPLENKFYGDRTGMVVDPYGHQWALMTHIEDVPPEEMEKRAAAEHAKMASSAEPELGTI